MENVKAGAEANALDVALDEGCKTDRVGNLSTGVVTSLVDERRKLEDLYPDCPKHELQVGVWMAICELMHLRAKVKRDAKLLAEELRIAQLQLGGWKGMVFDLLRECGIDNPESYGKVEIFKALKECVKGFQRQNQRDTHREDATGWSFGIDFGHAEPIPEAALKMIKESNRSWPVDDRNQLDHDWEALRLYLHWQRDWSAATFGPGPRQEGVCKHIEKELAEIREAPMDVREWIDVVILAFDGAWRCGVEPDQIVDALIAKQVTNFNRKWPESGPVDQAIEHIREEIPTISTPDRSPHPMTPEAIDAEQLTPMPIFVRQLAEALREPGETTVIIGLNRIQDSYLRLGVDFGLAAMRAALIGCGFRLKPGKKGPEVIVDLKSTVGSGAAVNRDLGDEDSDAAGQVAGRDL